MKLDQRHHVGSIGVLEHKQLYTEYFTCLTCFGMQDVTQFLSWAAEPEHDDRKLMGVKWIFVLSLVFLTAAYYKRWKWAPIKSRRVVVDALN